MTSSLGHLPASNRWAFDRGVTRVFSDMLQRSIPQYPEMRRIVTETGMQFCQDGTDIVDLGCSRGEGLAPFVEARGDRNRYHGLEISEPMLEAASELFAQEIAQGLMQVQRCDLRTEYPEAQASLTLGVLTLMFVPIEYRQHLLQRVYEHTVPGGAFILVEKLLGETASTQNLITSRYLRMKADNGYTQEEITRKRLSLEHVQVCLPASMNEAMLRASGFRSIEQIWRWYNFGMWVCIK